MAGPAANTVVNAQGRSSPMLMNLGIILMTLSSVRAHLVPSPTPRVAAVSRRDLPAIPLTMTDAARYRRRLSSKSALLRRFEAPSLAPDEQRAAGEQGYDEHEWPGPFVRGNGGLTMKKW